jgi:glycine cleavage system H protein
MAEFEYPSQLKYTPEHEWVAPSGDDPAVVRVGITAFAQDALGDIVFVQLPEPGQDVEAGQACGEVESTKSVSEVFAPLAGTVTARNEALDGSPELVNTDPYGDGWMLELRLSDPSAVEGLLDAQGYSDQVG